MKNMITTITMNINIPENTFNVEKYLEKETKEKEMLIQAIVDYIFKRWDESLRYCEISCTDGSLYRRKEFELPDGRVVKPSEKIMEEIAQEFNKKGYYVYDVDASDWRSRWRIFIFSQYPLIENKYRKRIV